MKNSIIFVVIIVSLIFLVLWYRACSRDDIVTETKVLRDTLIITQRDTIRDTILTVKRESVLDTVYIQYNDTIYVPIPITQREYEGSNYRLWVSGYQPRLDSIDVFNTIIETYITTTETQYVRQQSIDYYGYINGFVMKDMYGLGVGAMVVFPKGLLLTGTAGLANNQPYGMIGIGHRF